MKHHTPRPPVPPDNQRLTTIAALGLGHHPTHVACLMLGWPLTDAERRDEMAMYRRNNPPKAKVFSRPNFDRANKI